jgi:hypothetical protein
MAIRPWGARYRVLVNLNWSQEIVSHQVSVQLHLHVVGQDVMSSAQTWGILKCGTATSALPGVDRLT